MALLGGIVSAGSQAFNVTTVDSGFVPGQVDRDLYEYENFAFHYSVSE